jgi:hypothetical protein
MNNSTHRGVMDINSIAERTTLSLVVIRIFSHMKFQFVPVLVNNHGQRYIVPMVDCHEFRQFLFHHNICKNAIQKHHDSIFNEKKIQANYDVSSCRRFCQNTQ